MAEKFSLEDKIKRFGKKRVLRALTKRRFTNKKRSEMRKTGQKHMGFKKGGATEPKYSVKQEVKDKMKKETPKTFSLLKGLSPVTQMRKYMTGKKVKAARARDDAKVKKMMGGGMAGLFGKRKNVEAGEPDPKGKNKSNTVKNNLTKKKKRLEELKKELGMKKGGMKKADGIMLILEKKAAGGITGKTTFGQLSKRKPLKKGIRLKGKGSSFIKEYKKRVYNRAGGGSVNGGARGTGMAVKGHNFKGVF